MSRKGKPIIVIDRYTRAVIARYPPVKEAAKDLSIPPNTIYQSLCVGISCYEAYFIYENEFGNWAPSETAFIRVRGMKISKKLEELRKQS